MPSIPAQIRVGKLEMDWSTLSLAELHMVWADTGKAFYLMLHYSILESQGDQRWRFFGLVFPSLVRHILALCVFYLNLVVGWSFILCISNWLYIFPPIIFFLWHIFQLCLKLICACYVFFSNQWPIIAQHWCFLATICLCVGMLNASFCFGLYYRLEIVTAFLFSIFLVLVCTFYICPNHPSFLLLRWCLLLDFQR